MRSEKCSAVLALVLALLVEPATAQRPHGSLSSLTAPPSIGFGLAAESTASPIYLALSPNKRPKQWRSPHGSQQAAGQAESLRNLIARAEAGRAGYDAIHTGAHRLPVKSPTQLRLADIFAWIKATPGQPHAIGRYQFIPSTLRSLVQRADIGLHQRFSPALQDYLADMLLADAGFDAVRRGRISPDRFMYNLAGIWAGLPLPSGLSRYHGYAGNRATISWRTYQTEVQQILAAER